MVKDLLCISKELLNCLNSNNNFTEDEKNYILDVIHKMIIISMIELGKMNKPKIRTSTS